MLTENQ